MSENVIICTAEDCDATWRTIVETVEKSGKTEKDHGYLESIEGTVVGVMANIQVQDEALKPFIQKIFQKFVEKEVEKIRQLEMLEEIDLHQKKLHKESFVPYDPLKNEAISAITTAKVEDELPLLERELVAVTQRWVEAVGKKNVVVKRQREVAHEQNAKPIAKRR